MILELLLKLPPPLLPDPISSPKHPQASVTSSPGCCGAHRFQDQCAAPAGAASTNSALNTDTDRFEAEGVRRLPVRPSGICRCVCAPLSLALLSCPPPALPASRSGVARRSHCVWKEDSCKLAGSNDLLGVSCGSVLFAWGGGVRGGVDQKGGGQMKEGALPGVGCVTLD